MIIVFESPSVRGQHIYPTLKYSCSLSFNASPEQHQIQVSEDKPLSRITKYMEELFNVQFIEKCIYFNTSVIHTAHFLYVIKSSKSIT